MAIVGETSLDIVKESYNIILGLMVSLPSISLGSHLLVDDTIKQSEKVRIYASIVLSTGLVLYSKEFLIPALIINTLTIMYFKQINKNNSSHFGVWTNTLILMNILIGALYSMQLSLKE